MAKFALCIGVNQYGSGADLYGCVNDANAWSAELDRRGFTVRQLLDADATGDNIRAGIASLVEVARWGDVAVVSFSGHGTWVPDRDGDEADGRDEAICPVDFRNGVITDDELHDLFAARRHGARLVFVSDSCHSGTVNRLAAPVGDRPRVRYLPPEHHLPADQLPLARAVAALPARGKSRPTALLMAGCADREYAYDGYGQLRMGAFSAVALETLRHLPPSASYRDWMREIRKWLPAQDLPQTPALSGTRTQVSWPIFEGIPDR